MVALQNWRLLGLFAAITLCFCLYSLLQERLMTLPFGGERFRHSLFVIFVNRVVTVAVSAAALVLGHHSLPPSAPLWHFSVPSMANVLASAAQYEALKYVSFPLQALAKCAKTVPVMAWGLLLGGRHYSCSDYLCSAAVTLGCAIFVLTGDIAAPSIAAAASRAATAAAATGGSAAAAGTAAGGAKAAAAAAAAAARAAPMQHWALVGMALLAAFLLFDGLASTSQDRLFAAYQMHSCNQLLWVTAWSAGLSLSMLVATGQLAPAVRFVGAHPSCLGLMLGLSALSTAAQLFIFYTIQQYGALRFALVMTVRQFLSIVLSCLIFAHHLSAAQWAGTALVIGALVQRAQHKAAAGRPGSGKQGAPGPARPSPFSASPGGRPQLGEEGQAEDPLGIPVIQMGGAGLGSGKQSPPAAGPRSPGVAVSLAADGSGQAMVRRAESFSAVAAAAAATGLLVGVLGGGGGDLEEGEGVPLLPQRTQSGLGPLARRTKAAAAEGPAVFPANPSV